MKISLSLLALFLGTARANQIVKEVISESVKRLEAEGFYQDGIPDSVRGSPVDCIDGLAIVRGDAFECSEVDFLSFVSLNELEVPGTEHPFGLRGADIWGYVSPNTGKEITLMSMDHASVAVDTTDPLYPCILAKYPSKRLVDIWADVKVYDTTLYHVSDARTADAGEQATIGIEVFDLLKLDALDCQAPGFEAPLLEADFIFDGHGRSHNLVVNQESGRLYSVGTEQCAGGFMIIDVGTDQLKPEFLACADGDGYTHDGQCVVYNGPDPNYQGKEICFGYNEDTLTIWDLTDASNPLLISKLLYPNQAYAHQGWTNKDLTKVILDDELDELCNSVPQPAFCAGLVAGELLGIETTSTVVIDITDLADPFYDGVYIHPDLSIDHNLYVFGDMHARGWGGSPAMEFPPDPSFAYLNNYLAGLRILDISSDDVETFTEVGFFDITPNFTIVEFAGAWSGYLHPSGVYALSSIERGLFLLKPRMAFTDDFPQGPVDGGSDGDGLDDTLEGLLKFAVVLVVLASVLVCIAVCMLAKQGVQAQRATTKEVAATELY